MDAGAVSAALDVDVETGLSAQEAADVVGVVALVGEHDLRIGVALGHQVVKRGAVMGLARRQDQRNRKPLSVGRAWILVVKPPRERPKAWL